MASISWTDGAADGNWATAGNWSGGAAPVDNDVVTIGTSNRDITSGLNQSGINLNALYITDGFGGKIGTDSAALQINCDGAATNMLKIAGRGQYYKISGTIPTAEINVSGETTVYVAGGTWTDIRAGMKGNLEIDASAVVTNARIAGPSGSIGYNATGLTLLVLEGGSNFRVDRSWTTARVGSNARLKSWLAAAGTTTYIEPGGTHQHNSSGTMTTQEVMPNGKLTVEGQPNSSATWTTVYRYRGATVQDKFGATVTAITNDYNVGPPTVALAPTNA